MSLPTRKCENRVRLERKRDGSKTISSHRDLVTPRAPVSEFSSLPTGRYRIRFYIDNGPTNRLAFNLPRSVPRRAHRITPAWGVQNASSRNKTFVVRNMQKVTSTRMSEVLKGCAPDPSSDARMQ
ncbi:hypothetical protein EVAR_75066_1 [Eumeta japonica]|uniref:Uncharacterized protein n=1 Tax=Eumeta variegata TaxID=151549 RepID=A0A4C1W296_EUMVA|nr:hypothetical protein EVAR_75066_1 [Eumeta japonica]